MPRQSIGERAMTDAERQARYGAAGMAGKPVIRTRRPAEHADRWMQHRSASRPDHRSRAKRWNDAVAELVTLQAEDAAWLQSLADRLQDTATAEVLRTICERDLGALQAVIPPRGFGRDQTFIGGTACTRGPWRLKGSQALGLCPKPRDI